MKDKLLFFVGMYGRLIGVSMIALVSVWDILLFGIRGFYQYSIGYKGIAVIWAALVLILSAKYLQEHK